jgi:MFS transporter, CP family, cyanate transporter
MAAIRGARVYLSDWSRSRHAAGVVVCAAVSSSTDHSTPHPARWLVLFGVWLIYSSFGLIATSIAPLVHRIEHDLDMSHAAMGSVMGAWQLMFIAAAVPCGMALDRLGSRWALSFGALCIAASAYGRSVSADYSDLFLAVMLFGLGGPIISAGAPKVIADWFDGSSRGLAMGIYITGPAVGGAVSLMLTNSLLLPYFDGQWRPIFVLWAGLALAAGAAWWLIASLPGVTAHTAPRPVGAGGPHRAVLLPLLGRPAVRLVLFMGVSVFMLSHGLHNWLPEILINGGMSVVTAGYWAAIPTLVGIVGALLIPRHAIPSRRFVILAALSLVLTLATVLLQFDSRALVLIGLVLQGLARSSLLTVLILILVELPRIDARSAGTATGLFFAAAEIGGMLGPLGLGILYDATHGFTAGLLFFTLIGCAVTLAVGRLHRLVHS